MAKLLPTKKPKKRVHNANSESYVNSLLQELVEVGCKEEVRVILSFSAILKKKREEQKYGVRDIAQLMGIDKNTVVGIEKGKPTTTIFMIIRYARLLGLSLSLQVDLGLVVENRMDEIMSKLETPPTPQRNRIELSDIDDGLEL